MPLPVSYLDLDRRSGLSEELLDLSTSFPRSLGRSGFGLIYARVGSNPAGRLTLRLGGRVTAFSPGDVIWAPFRDVEIALDSASATTGTARLVLVEAPDVRYEESAKGRGEGLIRGTSYAATANATSNTPSAATDGISLVGVTAFRSIVSAASGQTLSGTGTVVYWLYSDRLGRWAESAELVYNQDLSNRRDASFPDEECLVGQGRVFLEARSVTVSGGALTVTLETVGVA